MISAKNMGRYYFDRKATVEECKSMSISFLKKHGYLKNSWKNGSLHWSINGESTGSISLSVDNDNHFVRVCYSFTNETDEAKKHRDYKIQITKTACHFGGFRYWFFCPFCYKRVGVLYLLGKNDFACRHCLNLSYASNNDSSQFRPYKRYLDADKLTEELYDLRVKKYNGKPTRKYKKLCERIERKERKCLSWDHFEMMY